MRFPRIGMAAILEFAILGTFPKDNFGQLFFSEKDTL